MNRLSSHILYKITPPKQAWLESPSLSIVRRLQKENLGELLVCEPNLKTHVEFELLDCETAIERADIVLLLVDHKQFRSLKAADLNEKVLIDTRGVIE